MKLSLLTFAVLFVFSSGLPPTLDSDGLHPAFQSGSPQPALDHQVEFDAKYWYDKATAELNRKTSTAKRAKNIILFMGDGLSIPTLTAARILLAKRNGKILSQSEGLSFEKFPVTGFSKTYCVDNLVADSACSATAFLGGAKGNLGTIGLSARVVRQNVKESLTPAYQIKSLAYLAQKNGKATGFVTNTRVTHASPAGAYAHIADRNWECDADMEKDGVNSKKHDDIAEQLFLREPGINFNVIMGGGRGKLIPRTQVDNENKNGLRIDGENLIQRWESTRKSKGQNYLYVTTRQSLEKMTVPDYLLGLFAHDHIEDNVEHNPKEPTLWEMTEAALKVLQKAGSAKGYFLFVEGGRIDMAHHGNKAQIALDEAIELSKAVEKAVKMTNSNDTLIVVTADHAHTMSISGYPGRDNSIFGFSGKAKDNYPYTTLNYANGPGYKPRKDLSGDNTEAEDYVFPAGVPVDTETHGGDDVAVYAQGPNAEIFTGVYEQSYIPHALAFNTNIRPKY